MKTKTQNKSTTKIKGVPSSDAERLEMVRKALSTIRNVRACRGGNRESVTLPIGRRDLAIDSRK